MRNKGGLSLSLLFEKRQVSDCGELQEKKPKG